MPRQASTHLSRIAATGSAGGRRYSVLLVSHSYPPVLGGSEIEAQRVAAALIGRGHRVQVVCAGGGPMPDQAEWLDPCGVPVRIFARSSERWRDHLFAASVAATIARQRKRFDVVYFLMQGLHLAAGLPVARLWNIPVVMKFSGSGIIPVLRESRIGRLELRWLQQWARKVMILNPGMEQEALEAGFRREQLLWMPNPVDTDQFAPLPSQERAALRSRLGIGGSDVVFLFVGRLAPEKELPSLIEAFHLLVRECPGCKLVLVGDGPERPVLERMAAANGTIHSAVRFAGRQPMDSVRQWLQAADAFTLVSSIEGFACSLVEAMAAGLPAVVSDIPANSQLIQNHEQGLIAATGNAASIAARMRELAASAELRHRLGSEARKVVIDNYSTDKIADRYEALFAEAVSA